MFRRAALRQRPPRRLRHPARSHPENQTLASAMTSGAGRAFCERSAPTSWSCGAAIIARSGCGLIWSALRKPARPTKSGPWMRWSKKSRKGRMCGRLAKTPLRSCGSEKPERLHPASQRQNPPPSNRIKLNQTKSHQLNQRWAARPFLGSCGLHQSWPNRASADGRITPHSAVPRMGTRGLADQMSVKASAALCAVAARTVGGQARRAETPPANKK